MSRKAIDQICGFPGWKCASGLAIITGRLYNDCLLRCQGQRKTPKLIIAMDEIDHRLIGGLEPELLTLTPIQQSTKKIEDSEQRK